MTRTLLRYVVALPLALLFLVQSAPGAEQDSPAVITVIGAGGAAEYSELFARWASRWRKAAREGGNRYLEVGPGAEKVDPGEVTDINPDANDLDRLAALIQRELHDADAPLWLVLLGHGTYDGRSAKFNLRGPDLSAEALSDLLAPFTRPVIVVACFSSSGPFLIKLSAPGRVILTSTRSGHEHNFSRFGEHLSAAIANPDADLDHDGQTSLLEAYLLASRRLAEFYASDGRLATELPLLDDTGDALGTPADWFRGTHVVKAASGNVRPDGPLAHRYHLVPGEGHRDASPEVRAQRQQLEAGIAELRSRKGMLDPDEYYRRLEVLLVELARLSKPAP